MQSMKVFRNEQVHLYQTHLFSNSKVSGNSFTVRRFIIDRKKEVQLNSFVIKCISLDICKIILKVSRKMKKNVGKTNNPKRIASLLEYFYYVDKIVLDTKQKFL
jgi:hypothetical protein